MRFNDCISYATNSWDLITRQNNCSLDPISSFSQELSRAPRLIDTLGYVAQHVRIFSKLDEYYRIIMRHYEMFLND
jgi:hypothetical protein